jgi:hypothetical protein
MTNLNTTLKDTVKIYVEKEAIKLGLLGSNITTKGKLEFQRIEFFESCAGESIVDSKLINNIPSEESKEQISYSLDTAAILEDDKNNLSNTEEERLKARKTQEIELAYVTRIIEEEYNRLKNSVITYEAPVSEEGNDISHLITGDF